MISPLVDVTLSVTIHKEVLKRNKDGSNMKYPLRSQNEYKIVKKADTKCDYRDSLTALKNPRASSFRDIARLAA